MSTKISDAHDALMNYLALCHSINEELRELPNDMARKAAIDLILDGICYHCGEVTECCNCQCDD